MTGSDGGKSDGGFFGQPRGLATLFFTEMWERFSFYGMRAILAYYLYYSAVDGGLGMPRSSALALVAAYGSAVYMASVAGAWVADRLLGTQRAVLYGGVLIMCGHITLAIVPGMAGVAGGLGLIIVGTGLLKSNVTAIVGTLYQVGDQRKDAGFSLFYMGINLGSFVAPLLTGLAASRADFHLGFGLAAIGMALGLVQYVLGRKHLGQASQEPTNPLEPAERRWLLPRLGLAALAAAGVLAVLALGGWLTSGRVVNLLSLLSVLLPVGYFWVMLRSRRLDRVERDRVLAFVPLFVASVMFWTLFEQQSTVIAAFADSRVDRDLLGFEIPPSWFQSVNPVAILLLAPLFALLWTRLGARQPGTPTKFSGGLVLVGVSFLVMMLASATLPEEGANPLWLAGALVVMTCGELLLSPVGLSVSTSLAPRAFAAQMVGLFMLSVAAGSGVGAQLVRLYSPESELLYFGVLGLVAVLLGVSLVLAAPLIRRRMHGVR
ncbi:peptide MFS transporter [Actinoalloteichus sp. AHMU CJ021]|uniref:Proton-dependent oligopeptide transporter, POT family n=1 Tax=Actinoalloteichus caeruleus DSM 43889 TaxID=1120930 RepID=A0ABT1JCN6_ACTCY|nr:peptide MFS transporter [Actinoalloteichus caeruleus]AUS80567.1 peptide MFS transporter [Actinoalloteichus sp. AHMU CJ021]MCP2329941.1 proton-dependent oligopeptide transporter, POT family [Actinoalloteichus caeruleus DSM 43889]